MIAGKHATRNMHPHLRAAVDVIERVHRYPQLAISGSCSTDTFCAIGVQIDIRGAIDYAGAEKIIVDILKKYKKILPPGIAYKAPGLTIET